MASQSPLPLPADAKVVRNIEVFEYYILRLLKSALADYVKEILKPAWKEGTMSKEAFKSIVKKVVDKVIGTL
ncbi:hypothetical protein GOP47_0027749 [Adiantum capillus-veneris]|nr:hypothetical protein GOP47_0027749 [Adiantum capillus-veneris]